MKFWLKSIFLLPGTFLHELMHLVFAMLLGAKVHSFSIFPKLRQSGGERYIELGSVGFSSRIRVLDFLIAFAPLFLWFMLWVILMRFNIVIGTFPHFSLNSSALFSFEHWWVWLVAFQLIVGGIPSSVDVKLAIKGFFSFSGLVVALGVYLYFFQYHLIGVYIEPIIAQVARFFELIQRSF